MTDNEIIKALECCFVNSNCNGCPQLSKSRCLQNACENAFYFINRLKAENEALISAQETLQKHISKTEKKYALAVAEREANVIGFIETINKIKAEARKEFAERLKGLLSLNVRVSNEDYLDISIDIDNLVKEMVGDTE